LSLLLLAVGTDAIAQSWQVGKTTRTEVIRKLGLPDHTLQSDRWIVDYWRTLYSQCWRYEFKQPKAVLHRYYVLPCPSDVRNI